MAQHLIRKDRLGIPQSARDAFGLLDRAGWIEPQLLTSLKNMVGFRNIAVRDHQVLQLPITVSIITHHLGDFLSYSAHIITKDAGKIWKPS